MSIAQKIKCSQVFLISFLLVSINIIAQQATEIDSKFVKLPRYANLSAITTAITTPLQGNNYDFWIIKKFVKPT